MAVEITELLEHAQSPDAALRNQAEQQLKQFEEQNAVAYLTALASELASSPQAGRRETDRGLDPPRTHWMQPMRKRRSVGPGVPTIQEHRSAAAEADKCRRQFLGTIVHSVCALQAALVARWQAMDDAAKQHIKAALLATLPSDASYCPQPASFGIC